MAGLKRARPCSALATTDDMAGQGPVKAARADRRPTLEKGVALRILAMASEMRLADKLCTLDEAAKARLVERHCADRRFMAVAVAHDRCLLRFAAPELRRDRDLVAAAVRPVLASLGSAKLEPMPVPVHAESQLTWQRLDADATLRASFSRRIALFLLNSRPFAAMEWIERFAAMVPRIELHFYLAARDRDEYSDSATVQVRLARVYKKLKVGQTLAAAPTLCEAHAAARTASVPLGA